MNGNIVATRMYSRLVVEEIDIIKKHTSDQLLENQGDFRSYGRKWKERKLGSLYINAERSMRRDILWWDINKIVMGRLYWGIQKRIHSPRIGLIIDEEMEVDRDSPDLPATRRSIETLMAYDTHYKLLIYTEYGIGLPLERVGPHVKYQHGMKISLSEDGTEVFPDEWENTLTVAQAEYWIQSLWMGKAVQNIPVIPGTHCKEYQYSMS
jgi:hypothetical protein